MFHIIVPFMNPSYIFTSPLVYYTFIYPGKKLPVYPTEESEVLLLSERVMEANRLAKIELKVNIKILSC